MDIRQKLLEIGEKRKKLAQGGGATAIEKQHSHGKLTASERMEKLFDPRTFHELYSWAKPLKTGFGIDDAGSPRAGLVTGYGEIEGRIVYASSSDFTVHGGSQNAMQMVKMGKVMQQARDEGVPFVGIIDSGGRQIQDLLSPWGMRPPARIDGCEEGAFDMFCPPIASGVIPQVSLMLGPCYAGTAYSPIMADFVFFRKGTSFMSLASPPLLKAVTFADVTQDEIGGALLHATTTGSCDILVDDDEEALNKCRQLLSFMPSNWKEKPPFVDTGDDPKRKEEELLELVPSDESKPFDMHRLISLIVDKGEFFELASLYAQNMIIGFARLAGHTVGIVANNPMVADGSFDANSCDKEARFIRTCDCFNIPLIFLVDTPGFPPSLKQEQGREGLERHAAKPLFAICEATVPKIAIYLRRCYGAGRLVMGTKEIGVDAVFAWPSADHRIMNLKSLARLIYRDELAGAEKPQEIIAEKVRRLNEEFSEPYNSGEMLTIDDIIDPQATRHILVKRLRSLPKNQGSTRPWRKHGLIPM